jgi:hypothetical protein
LLLAAAVAPEVAAVAAVMRVQEQLQEQRLLLLVQLVKLMPQLRPV